MSRDVTWVIQCFQLLCHHVYYYSWDIVTIIRHGFRMVLVMLVFYLFLDGIVNLLVQINTPDLLQFYHWIFWVHLFYIFLFLCFILCWRQFLAEVILRVYNIDARMTHSFALFHYAVTFYCQTFINIFLMFSVFCILFYYDKYLI